VKGKKFYISLAGLIIIGLISVFFYQRQQEARFLAFQGYEISEIEERVAGLYNEDKTDIIENISEEELAEIDAIFLDLKDGNFGQRNERRLTDAEVDFLMAREMNTIQESIQDIFIEEDIIDQDISIENINNLEQEVNVYEIKPVYYERNIATLEDAKTQISDIKTATEFIDNLFEEEDIVHENVTREDEEEAFELIEPIRNEEVKERLTNRVDIISIVLTEREEALALEEELEAEEEEELAEEEDDEFETELEEEPETEYSAPANNWNRGSSESTWTPPASDSSNGSRGSGYTGGPGNTNGGGNSGNIDPPSSSDEEAEESIESDEDNETEDSSNGEEPENIEDPNDPDNSNDSQTPQEPAEPEIPTDPETPED
jgi:hypothetical protein